MASMMQNTPSDKVRINKYLATLGVAARRKIDTMVEQGRVTVNGVLATLGQTVVPGKDKILLDAKPIQQETKPTKLEHYLFYKPTGVVSTVSDPEGRPTVLKYFAKHKTRLYPVGRLDQESEGLMLITNDGELANQLSHPKYHMPKTYLVRVSGELTPRKLDQLRRGVKLKDGFTAPCEIEATQLQPRRWSLVMTLWEGKNRQIRRMLPHVELEVLVLKRIQFGPLSLGALKPGESRPLTEFEIKMLQQPKPVA
jgi:23S rRNA pseudouridine2605 synthase